MAETKIDSIIKAAKMSAKLGRTLQLERGEQIVDLYRSGRNASDIAKELNIGDEYHYSSEVLLIAIRKAIRGHKGNFGITEYEGLIPLEERVARIPQTQRDYGNRVFESKKGIHNPSYQKSISALARGFTPWTTEEIEKARELAKREDYHRGKLINQKKIADELNLIYHKGQDVRTPKSVNSTISKRRLK